MFRLLGIVIGSVISIGGILLVLGIPQFDFSSFESDQARFDAAVQKLREKQAAIDDRSSRPTTGAATGIGDKTATQPADKPVGAPARTPATAGTGGAAVGEEADADRYAAESAGDRDDGGDNPSAAIPADRTGDELTEAELAAELQWQDFWTPFRSEIAARGFVSQLERVTGLDYRIVKVKAGEYQVAFAFHGDGERRLHIQQIADATGLDLPET